MEKPRLLDQVRHNKRVVKPPHNAPSAPASGG